MGSVGAKTSSGGLKGVIDKAEKYTQFTDIANHTDKWFSNEDLSNLLEWYSGLSVDEQSAIWNYTGSGYSSINEELYGTKWDDIPDYLKERISHIYDAISRFELHKGITTYRKCDTLVLGAGSGDMTEQEIIDHLKATNGVVQLNGFLSSSAGTHGVDIGSHGSSKIEVEFKVPPNKGLGAWVWKRLSGHDQEKEFLFNNNLVVQYDINSLKKDAYGRYKITAYVLGQADDQVFNK